MAVIEEGATHNVDYLFTVKQLEHRMTWDPSSLFDKEKSGDTFLVQYLMDARLAFESGVFT